MKRNFNKLFFYSVATMAFCSNGFAEETTTVTYNATQANQNVVVPFGANVINPTLGAELTAIQQLFQLPGFRMARMGNYQTNNGNSTPLTGTLADYQTWWGTYGPGEIHGPAPAHDLQLPGGTYNPIQYMFLVKMPGAFLQSDGAGGKKLITSVDLTSLANYIAAGVEHFNQSYGAFSSCPGGTTGCYKADYVELSNEPNGNWTVNITPAQYNTLIKLVYTQLQSLGIDTQITGPGAGNIDWKTGSVYGTDTYVKALDSTAISNLGAWSVHQYVYSTVSGVNYENKDATSTVNGYGQTAARYFFPKWNPTVSSKPVIVSEYATKATGFHNISYSPPNSSYPCLTAPFNSSNCTIVNTTSYGVRMYAYMISLLTAGANGALYWEAKDQSFEAPASSGWGLLDLSLNLRTNYYAMLPLFQNVLANSTVLTSTSTQNGNDIYGAVFLSPKNIDGTVNCMTIALANGTATSNLTRTTKITNLPATATGYTATTQLFSQLGSTVYQGQLTTDPTSTFSYNAATQTLTHTATLAKDTSVTANVCLTY